MPISDSRRKLLEKEIPILRAEILALYRKLDHQFSLQASSLPLDFSYEEDKLGAYMPAGHEDGEHFEFSLPAISYAAVYQLSKPDREDLYRHEYAHYMNHHLEIPREYLFEPGIHGSAWRYCCSLVGAVPSPFYRVGESLKKQDYEKVLTPRKTDMEKSRLLDIYHREQAFQEKKNSAVRFSVGDTVTHAKFGEGIIEAIEPQPASVRLVIRFRDQVRKLDQKWVLRSKIE